MYRLLIVDDEKDICDNIKYLLDWPKYGFTSILTAASYSEAVSKAMDFSPHVALVDIKLGDHWGYDLANHLRNIGMKTVFCMISGYDDYEYIRKSMQASAQDYLLKPLNVKELQSFVERTILRDLHGTLPESCDSSQEIDPVLHMEYAQFSKITNKIILIIKGDCRSSQSLTRIAEIFNMSSKYIGRIFLKDTGMKFTDYLTAYRMLEAKRLLENTHEKISVIASMAGYSQLNNFYTHFKNYFGISPSTMRSYGMGGVPPDAEDQEDLPEEEDLLPEPEPAEAGASL